MTRKFDQKINCPNCGSIITAETSFGRWLRNHPDLESESAGVSLMDMDYIFHRFRSEMGRDFQLLMVVEVKKNGAEVHPAQRDTAHVLNQLIRNRARTPTKDIQFQADGSRLIRVFSTYTKKRVWLRAFGVHVLTFEGIGPADSDWIKWDFTQITQEQLIGLLRFDLDPDTLRPMDWRSHHTKNDDCPLFQVDI